MTLSPSMGWRFDAFDRVAVLVQREAFRAQGHALVKAHVATDDAGFADHHARSVVDHEAFPDVGSGVDVDSGDAVRPFRHNP